MKLRKVTSLVLAGAMVAGLAACGGSSSSAKTTTAAADAKETTAAAAAGETKSGGSASASADYSSLDPVELIGADSTGKGAAGQIFGELVASKVDEITGGKLTIDYHPNGDLGGDAYLLRQEQSGDIDIVVCQTAPVVSFIPEMAVFDLPMVFAKYDGDKIDKVLNSEDSEFNKSLSSAYDKAGYKLLGFLQNATFRLTTSNKELKTLDDFKGLKIRTMENSNHMAFWSAIGAAPTPLAWAEVYISLQNGTIDAEENAADTCVGANFQEVQKYLSLTNHILYANQISINKDKFASLDPLYQQALQQAVSEAIDEMRPQLEKIDTDSKKTLQDGGMTITEYDDSFYDQVLALDGVKDLYKQINESVNGLGDTLQKELEK